MSDLPQRKSEESTWRNKQYYSFFIGVLSIIASTLQLTGVGELIDKKLSLPALSGSIGNYLAVFLLILTGFLIARIARKTKNKRGNNSNKK